MDVFSTVDNANMNTNMNGNVDNTMNHQLIDSIDTTVDSNHSIQSTENIIQYTLQINKYNYFHQTTY